VQAGAPPRDRLVGYVGLADWKIWSTNDDTAARRHESTRQAPGQRQAAPAWTGSWS